MLTCGKGVKRWNRWGKRTLSNRTTGSGSALAEGRQIGLQVADLARVAGCLNIPQLDRRRIQSGLA